MEKTITNGDENIVSILFTHQPGASIGTIHNNEDDEDTNAEPNGVVDVGTFDLQMVNHINIDHSIYEEIQREDFLKINPCNSEHLDFAGDITTENLLKSLVSFESITL